MMRMKSILKYFILYVIHKYVYIKKNPVTQNGEQLRERSVYKPNCVEHFSINLIKRTCLLFLCISPKRLLLIICLFNTPCVSWLHYYVMQTRGRALDMLKITWGTNRFHCVVNLVSSSTFFTHVETMSIFICISREQWASGYFDYIISRAWQTFTFHMHIFKIRTFTSLSYLLIVPPEPTGSCRGCWLLVYVFRLQTAGGFQASGEWTEQFRQK